MEKKIQVIKIHYTIRRQMGSANTNKANAIVVNPEPTQQRCTSVKNYDSPGQIIELQATSISLRIQQ